MASKRLVPSRKRAGSPSPLANTTKKRATKAVSSPHPPPKSSKPRPQRPQRRFTRNTPPTKKLQLYVFGTGSGGELGLGPKNPTEVSTPRINPLLAGAVEIATGGMPDNKIYTWGINDDGNLGRDTEWDGGFRDIDAESSDSDDGDLNPKESTPAEVTAGDSTTFALTTTGLVYGWGTFRDHKGDCRFTVDSEGKFVGKQLYPMQIPGLKNIIQVSAGSNFALALDYTGQVFAWGCGEQNELGHRVVERRLAESYLPTPVGLPRRIRFVSVHSGANHSFAIDASGDTWSWGSNNFGQTGISHGVGESGATTLPRRIPALVGVGMKKVEGGNHHSVGVTQSGTCLVWGRMDGFQLGLDISKLLLDDPSKVIVDSRGKPRILVQPTPLPLPLCDDVAVGSDHSFAVTREGRSYSWGFNTTYQCGQGTTDDIEVAKMMNGKQIREEKIVWVGAGGQYGMIASLL